MILNVANLDYLEFLVVHKEFNEWGRYTPSWTNEAAKVETESLKIEPRSYDHTIIKFTKPTAVKELSCSDYFTGRLKNSWAGVDIRGVERGGRPGPPFSEMPCPPFERVALVFMLFCYKAHETP